MYDDFGADYDRFVNWPARLSAELPFLDQQLVAAGARRALDVACGTGMHAISLAGLGYEVAGCDSSPRMIEVALDNARDSGVAVSFGVAAFGEVAGRLGGGFDALLCLGSSLPHVLEPEALDVALADFRACLSPGGVLLIQNRNFDAVLARHERWMVPQGHTEGATDWVFIRFYDFEPDGSLAFNVVTLRREGAGSWTQRTSLTRLWPMRQSELESALRHAGFEGLSWYGAMDGSPFDVVRSPDLVAVARAA